MYGQLQGLKFLLGNHFFAVALPAEKVRQYITDWKDGKLRGVIGDITGPEPWAINADEIRGLHSFPLEEALPAAQQGRPFAPKLNLGQSGM